MEQAGARKMQRDVHDFWNGNPCGEHQIGAPQGDLEAFFDQYDGFRYSREPHILKRISSIDFQGKRVLEIGLGLGADSEQIIRRGAIWSGIDLTPASVERVRQRLEIRRLPHEGVQCASALSIPYPDGYFDIVFSHGVLHHIPAVTDAQREIARVLKPGGKLVMMVYAKRSLNYLLAISIVRRLGLALCFLSGVVPPGKVGEHVRNARSTGLLEYMKMKNFLGRNTDGPGNPYSKVYSISDVKADFPDFRVVTHGQEWMHAPPLPVGWLKALSGVLGWHLWVELVPIPSSGRSPAAEPIRHVREPEPVQNLG
jgi:SAM-dependent methyltransferase